LGPKGYPDTLSIFFIHAFERRGLLDIEPNKLNLTWRNRRNGDGRVAKRLDRFLVAEHLVDSLYLIRQWVACGGELDHSPIVLEFRGRGRKPPSPFKFNAKWLKDQSYKELVKDIWTPFNLDEHRHAIVHFVENMKKIKQAMLTWAHAKKVREELEPKYCERKLQVMQSGDGSGFIC
jgi:hypothetical protein